MKKVILVLLCTVLSISVTSCKNDGSRSHLKKVAITQIVEHPSLEQEREGILGALKEAGYIDGQNIQILYENSQGSPVVATQIALKFVSQLPDVIVAISTPSAQAAIAAIGKQKIPLVFSAVTDPVGSKLVKEGVTGVSDQLPPEPQLDFVAQWLPGLKNLGMIYNPGETNSVKMAEDLKTAAHLRGIHIVVANANQTRDVAAAAQSLIGKVEAIYIPNDNTAVSAIESISSVGIQQKVPILAGDSGSAQRGAAASIGYNRLALGKAAGKLIARILSGEPVQNIPIQKGDQLETVVNLPNAEKMGVHIPKGLKPAKVIGGSL